jgi:hypothetical protein
LSQLTSACGLWSSVHGKVGWSCTDFLAQVSRPAKDLTPFGRRLRSALFTELHRLKDEIISEKGGATAVDGTTEDTTPAGQLPSPGTAEELLREA